MGSMIIYGNHSNWYDIINNLSIVACEILVFLLLSRIDDENYFVKIFKSRIDRNKKFKLFSKAYTYSICILSIFIISSVSGKIAPYISNAFLHTYDDNYFSNIFVVPVISFFIALLIRISPSTYMDISCLCVSLCLIFFKTACYFSGCCNGVEYNGIFYNQGMEQYQVPVQLIELVCAIIMFIIIILLYLKEKMSGKLFPLFMIMYCGSRFVSEFWRGDYPAVIGRLTGYHIQCIIGFALGAVYMLIAVIFGKKINSFIQNKNEAYVEKTIEKLPEWRKKHPVIWEFIKYQVAGIVASCAEVVVHMLLLNVIFYNLTKENITNPFLMSIGIESIGYFISFAISTLVGYSIGFVFSRKIVFKSDANPTWSIIKYLFLVVFTVILSGWIGTQLEMVAFRIDFVGLIKDLILKVVCMIIPIIWVYPCNKFIVHRDHIFKKTK